MLRCMLRNNPNLLVEISGELIALREQTNLSWVIRLYRINYPGWSTSRWFKTITRCRIPLRKEPWNGISGQCGNSVYMDI